jgi:hypothetical protein
LTSLSCVIFFYVLARFHALSKPSTSFIHMNGTTS